MTAPRIPSPEFLPADVQNRADQELGAAWRRAEAALPSGWRIDRLEWEGYTWGEWMASAEPCPGCKGPHGSGPTPTLALQALAAVLEERRAGSS